MPPSRVLKQQATKNVRILETRLTRLLENRGGYPRPLRRRDVAARPQLVDFERVRGLRFIVEADSGETLASVQSRMKVQLGVLCRTERLFRYYRPGRDLPRMADFYVSTIPAIAPADLQANAFDIGYEVARRAKFRSVIPDPGAGVMSSLCYSDDANPPVGWALTKMRVPEAWNVLRNRGVGRGAGVLIGHPDTGYTRHKELGFRTSDADAQSTGELDNVLDHDILDDDSDALDPHEIRPGLEQPGHGTATASIMVSRGDTAGDDYLGRMPGDGDPGDLVGVAPDAEVVPIRCVTSVILVWASDVARAVEYATASGCHVISMSLGGLVTPALEVAVDNAVRQNLIVMAAAGNCVGFVVAPAVFDNCLAVAACNENNGVWRGSSYGPKITITAPGEHAWHGRTTQGTGPDTRQLFEGIRTGQGTSFAVANLAGVAALWLTKCGGPKEAARTYAGTDVFVQDAFRSVIRSTAKPIEGWDTNNYGPGIVDAEAAVKKGCIPPRLVELPPGHRPGGPDGPLAWLINMLGIAAGDVGALKVKLMAILDARNEAELRDKLEQFGTEFVQVLARDQARAREFKEQVAADAQAAIQQAEERAKQFVRDLGDAVSHTLRSLVGL